MANSIRSDFFRRLVDRHWISAKELVPIKETDSELIKQAVRESIGGPIVRVAEEIDALIMEIIIEGEYSGKKLEPYLAIARILQDCIRNSNPASSISDWEKAVSIVCKNQTVFYYGFNQAISAVDHRAVFLSRCARNLQKLGYKITFDGKKPLLSDDFLKFINLEIDRLCSELGGIDIIGNIMLNLKEYYSLELARYVIPRHYGDSTGKIPAPQIPWSYLLLLASFYTEVTPVPLEPSVANKKWNHLIQLVTNAVALLDIQPIKYWEEAMPNPISIWDILSRGTKLETICFPTQTTGSHFTNFSKHLIETYQIKYRAVPKLKRVFEVADTILKNASNIAPTLYSPESLNQVCNYSEKDIKEALEVLTTPRLKSRSDLNFIPNLKEKWFKHLPMLKVEENKYLLVSPCFSASTLLESILEVGRESEKHFDDRIGTAAETFLHSEFNRRGIAYASGIYGKKNRLGDCDLVVETDDTISFFEIKKKSFVRQSQGGDPIYIYIDLLMGLVKAQSQALKHELVLRDNGFIDLKDSYGSVYRLEFKNRKVRRYSIVWNDLGFLHDKNLCIRFLEIIDGIEFMSDHKELDTREKFNSLRKERDALKILLDKLSEKHGIERRELFFSTSFLSLQILETAFNKASNTKEFIEELTRSELFATGTRDWYYDYLIFKNTS